jgi:hypothetical protein
VIKKDSISGTAYLVLLCTTTGSVLFQRYVLKEVQNILHLNTRCIQIITLYSFYYMGLSGELDGTTV